MFDNNCRKDLRQFRHVLLVPVFFYHGLVFAVVAA